MKRTFVALIFGTAILVFGAASASAQLFENLLANLRALGGARYPVGDPSITLTNLDGDLVKGPKDIAVADLDGDGTPDFAASDKDGSVTIYYGFGDGTFSNVMYLRTWIGAPADLRTLYFTNYYTNVFCDHQPTNFTLSCYTNITFPPPPNPPIRLTNVVCFTNYQYGCVGMITNVSTNIWDIEGPVGLRGLALADLTGDGRQDIAVASPGESLIYLFSNQGGRSFSSATNLPGWFGVRDLATGDFDGDGLTDLAAAGTTNGLAHFRSLGGGVFELKTNILELASDASADDDEDYDFPQPAYYLKAVRQPGDTQDELVVSFAQRRKIWVLRADSEGRLAIAGDIENVSLTALDAAPLLRPATNGAPPDLITAYSRGGCVDIFAATNRPQRFAGQTAGRYFVPGGPRNVRIADFDRDGWNDVVVVAQHSDRVLTYRNEAGRLTLATEAFAGRFPREMDLGDFNGDSRPDLAVLNRYSQDASVFITSTNLSSPMGFLSLDNVYPVDGGVSGLNLSDFNGDGRPDVMQLHRDTSEFSVRLTETNGTLGPATFYAITNAFQPAAQLTVDVNGDGRPDMVSANMSGSITVRLGLPDGTFGPEQTFELPSDGSEGRLMAVAAGDFDNDSKVDLAAAYWDCRISFFKGDGTGRFTFMRTHPLIYEPRSLAVGDFDQDGDLDVIGASIISSLGFVVVENKGDLLTTTELTKKTYAMAGDGYGNSVRLVDQNGDSDPDLLFGQPGGFSLWLGGPGLTFVNFPIDNGDNNPGISGSTFVSADLDGNGVLDIATICSSNSCLTIQTLTNGQLVTVFTVPVPITLYLAAGDLDGDGFTDLVGSGDVLWVALSSRPPSNAPPSELLANRAGGVVVINEVLPQNSDVPLEADGDRTSDWIEIYNGGSQPMPLTGWRLLLVQTNTSILVLSNFVAGTNQVFVTNQIAIVTNTFVFPNDLPLAPKTHRLVICTERRRTLYHTGFTLPAESSLLCLFNAQGVEMNRVVYPAMDEDLAYARYADGGRTFVVNNIPSPGAPNVDNGAVEPELAFTGVDIDTLLTPERPLRFRATASDDIAIVNVSVLWRRLDVPDNVTKRVILFDDGMNEDGGMNDGQFSGVMNEPLPSGAQIQFYVECTDLSDQTVRTPGNPRFVAAGTRAQTHALAMGMPRPPLEISEIVADNVTGLTDEGGGRPDWVEIRNCSANTVSLAGVGLGPKFFGDGERMAFTNRPTIGPGEHLVVYADSNPTQGALHAPFRLDRLGEQLILTGSTANGARYFIDALYYGPQSRDTALARLGCGGPWVTSAPTPRMGNVTGLWRTLVQPDRFLLAFPTRAGRTYTVEFKDSVATSEWISSAPVTSVGLEMTVQQSMGAARFFRAREE